MLLRTKRLLLTHLQLGKSEQAAPQRRRSFGIEKMPTPCRRSGRRMGSAHILDLCSFPSLGSIQIHRIELSCCLPFFQHLLFESKLWVHTVVHGYTLSFTFCCMFCINLLSLYDSSLSPTNQHVFVQSYIFSCVLFQDHTQSFRRRVLQIWKDGVVKYLSSCQEFGGG